MRPRTALAWEHSARTLPFVLIGLAAGIVCSISAQQMARYYFDDIEAAWILHTITISIASLGILYTLSSDDRLICGIPPSALMLPVPVRDIVFIRFALGTASMVLLSAVFYQAQVWWFFPPTAPWWVYVAAAGGLFAVLQLVAIASAPLGDLSVGLLGAVLLSGLWYFGLIDVKRTLPVLALGAIVTAPVVALGIVQLQRHGQWTLNALRRREPIPQTSTTRSTPASSRLVQRLFGKPTFIRVWIGLTAGLYVFQMVRNSILAVIHDYDGTLQNRGLVYFVDYLLYYGALIDPSLEEFVYTTMLTFLVLFVVREIKIARAASRSNEPFRSPAEAQRWFEAMRIWPLYLGVISVGLAYAVVVESYEFKFLTSSWDVGDVFPYLPRNLIFTSMLGALLVGCVMTFLNFRLQSNPMRAFLYLRPLHTRDLAAARLFAVLRILGPFALISLVTVLGVAYFENGVTDPEEYLLTLAGSWGAIWTATAVFAFVIGNTVLAIADVQSHGITEFQVVAYATGLASVLFAATFFIAQRRRLIVKPLFLTGLAVCVLAWLRAVDFFLTRTPDGFQFNFDWQYHHTENTISLMVIACFVLSPILTVPLLMQWTRHR